jgi:hypothetical protein
VRRIFDVCVFAPVGVAVTVVDDFPEIVTKGRAHIEQDLSNARVVGRYVLHREWRRLSKRLGEIFGNETAQTAPADAEEPVAADEAAPGRDDEPAASETDVPPAALAPRAEPVSRAAAAPPAAAAPAPDAAAEAIVGRVLADYDTLSASQVVRRLESLGPEELRAVQSYEGSTRNRRTILNRASQLLDQGPAAAHSG